MSLSTNYAFFLTLFKPPTPHPPLPVEHLVDFFDGLGVGVRDK